MPTNREGFEDLYYRNEPKLYRALLATTGKKELAEDATQEAFTHAYAFWETVHNPPAWVWTVAHNCLKQWWKQQNHECWKVH
jgi:DNA-directed RNA polymerase specialized sigma24 family protein